MYEKLQENCKSKIIRKSEKSHDKEDKLNKNNDVLIPFEGIDKYLELRLNLVDGMCLQLLFLEAGD